MDGGGQGKEDTREVRKECLEETWKRVSVCNKFKGYLGHSPLETCTFYHAFYINEHNE